MFITFEGLDSSGKSTQVQLLADRLSRTDHNVLVLREPGGTEIGEKIRKLLLDKQTLGMTDACELFLFSASRAQLVAEVVKPALDGRMVVVCDRYMDSTTAYQGWGRAIPVDVIQAINRCATSGVPPDLTLFIDVPVAELQRRMMRASKDRMESSGNEFFERVRAGYLALAKSEPRFKIMDGMMNVDDLHESVWQEVEHAFEKTGSQQTK